MVKHCSYKADIVGSIPTTSTRFIMSLQLSWQSGRLKIFASQVQILLMAPNKITHKQLRRQQQWIENPCVVGSIPTLCTKLKCTLQLSRQSGGNRKPRVTGSTPVGYAKLNICISSSVGSSNGLKIHVSLVQVQPYAPVLNVFVAQLVERWLVPMRHRFESY